MTEATGKPVKLTIAQLELLVRLAQYGAQHTVRNYSTAVVLTRLGFVIIEDVLPPYGWKLTITDAGCAHPAVAKV